MGDYPIQSGDSLSTNTKNYGLSAKKSQDTNGIKSAKLILDGKTLKLADIESDDAFKLKGLSIESNPKNQAAEMVYSGAEQTELLTDTIDVDTNLVSYAAEAAETPETEQAAAAEEPAAEAEETEQSSKKDEVQTPAKKSNKWEGFLGTDGEKEMVCRDASGLTQNIEGKLRIVDASKDGEDPQSFTITDTSSGSPHEYLYQKIGVDENGKAIYKCVSMNGDPITSPNQYTLEWTDDNKPELVQHKGQDNHGVGLQVGKKTDTPPVTEPEPEPAEEEPEPEKPAITPEERAKARGLGDDVSDYLVGYTSDSEAGHVRRIVENEITDENVADFLKGYEDNKALGDSFFEQLESEWGFRGKQEIMRDVARKLSANLRANGQGAMADEVDKILQNNPLSEDDAKALDKIVAGYLPTLPEIEE